MFLRIVMAAAAGIILNSAVCAQEEGHGHAEAEEGMKHTHRITLSMGHAHIREGLQNEDGITGITTAAWALDYDYWLSNHLGIGLHSDMLLENFAVMSHLSEKEGEVLERSHPVASVPVLLFKPFNHLLLMGGVGGEFAKEEHFLVYRMGTEFSWHMPKSWEMGVSLTYDVKKNSYDTWILGVGISRLFHPKRS